MSEYPFATAIFILFVFLGFGEYFTDNPRIVWPSRLATLLGGLTLGVVLGFMTEDWQFSVLLGLGIGMGLIFLHMPAAWISRKYREAALKAWPDQLTKLREIAEENHGPNSVYTDILDFVESKNFIRFYIGLAIILFLVFVIFRLF